VAREPLRPGSRRRPHIGAVPPPFVFIPPTRPQRPPLYARVVYPPPPLRPQITKLAPRAQPAAFAFPFKPLVARITPPPPGPRPQLLRAVPAAVATPPTRRPHAYIVVHPVGRFYWPAPQDLRPLYRGRRGHGSLGNLASRINKMFRPQPWPKAQILRSGSAQPISIAPYGPVFSMADPGTVCGYADGGVTFTLPDPGTTASLPLS
jgi:hypothetical protein